MTIDHHDALIYAMVLAAGADRDMTDAELRTIGEIVNYLPVFKDFDSDRLIPVARGCAQQLTGADGLGSVLATIKAALPAALRETAFALACDVAAADGASNKETRRLLEMLAERLGLDALTVAAFERSATARHATLMN